MGTSGKKPFSYGAVLLGILVLFFAFTFFFVWPPAYRDNVFKNEQGGTSDEQAEASQPAALNSAQGSSVPTVTSFEELRSHQEADLETPPLEVSSVPEPTPEENESRDIEAIQNQLSPAQEDTTEWVLVRGGKFNASLDGPGSREFTEVTLSYDFYIAKTEVTISQFKSLMPKVPFGPFLRGLPEHAGLTHVGWDDAMAYCQEFSKLVEGIPAGYVCRLPTEAEWEYACRVSVEDAENTLEAQTGESKPGAAPKATVVGMHEHPAEWCLDVLKLTSTPAIDPVGRMEGPHRSLRGTRESESVPDCGSRHVAHGSRGIREAGFRPVLAPVVSRLVTVTPR